MLASNLSPTKSFELSTYKWLKAPASYYCLLDKEGIIQEQAKGTSAINGGRAIDEKSQFPLFSISKTFTAIAILQLHEQGKLSLKSSAFDLLPQYNFLDGVSIRHLLSHQSGLNNPIPISWVHLVEEEEDFDYQRFSFEILSTKAKRKYAPGQKAVYSNLNYLLLGEIVEKLSGHSFKQYIIEHVLAGNPHIDFKWNNELAVSGYHEAGINGWILGLLLDRSKFTEPKRNKLIQFRKNYLNGPSYGGLLASPQGLNLHLQGLLQGNGVLSEASCKLMFTEQSLTSGKPSGLALGWFKGALKGRRYLHHAGGGGGFYLELRVYPEAGLASYLLTNKSGFSDQRRLDALDVQFL